MANIIVLFDGRSVAGRFLRDRRGVAATEFALLMPILFISYLVTFEVTLAIETQQKADRIGSAVADLVAQQQSLSKADIGQILEISDTIIRPYNRSTQAVKVTAIQVSDENVPKASVVWSARRLDTGYGRRRRHAEDPSGRPSSPGS